MNYIIFKNSQECSPRVYQEHDFKNGFAIQWTIGEDWKTDLGNAKLNLQSSKIGGGSFGTVPHSLWPYVPAHQWESARVSIRPTTANNDGMTQTGMFDIMAYHYNRGVLKAVKLCEVGVGQNSAVVMFRREIQKIAYIAGAMKDYKLYPFDWSGVPTTGYKLYPYFGGNAKAPWDLHIDMEIKGL